MCTLRIARRSECGPVGANAMMADGEVEVEVEVEIEKMVVTGEGISFLLTQARRVVPFAKQSTLSENVL